MTSTPSTPPVDQRGRRGSSAAEEARARFSEGRNCAESVLTSLSAAPGLPALDASLGSGFTLGIGHSGCVCGAVAASTMVIGAHVDGLGLEPVAAREHTERLTGELAARFKERWGSTCCRVLKRGMADGSAEAATHCAQITEFAAGLVTEILAEESADVRTWVVRDVVSGVRRWALDILSGAAIGVPAALVLPGSAVAAVLLCLGVGAGLGAWAESGPSARRRFGRLLRTAGMGAAALVAMVAVLVPGKLATLGVLLGEAGGPGSLVARVTVLAATVVVAGISAHGQYRFR